MNGHDANRGDAGRRLAGLLGRHQLLRADKLSGGDMQRTLNPHPRRAFQLSPHPALPRLKDAYPRRCPWHAGPAGSNREARYSLGRDPAPAPPPVLPEMAPFNGIGRWAGSRFIVRLFQSTRKRGGHYVVYRLPTPLSERGHPLIDLVGNCHSMAHGATQLLVLYIRPPRHVGARDIVTAAIGIRDDLIAANADSLYRTLQRDHWCSVALAE